MAKEPCTGKWKAGTEYSFEVTEDFEIALNLTYENKEEMLTPTIVFL